MERENFILKFIGILLMLLLIVSLIVNIKLSEEYNRIYTEANFQIKQLIIENKSLSKEYEQLLKDNEENVRQIEWLNDQMVKLRGG